MDNEETASEDAAEEIGRSSQHDFRRCGIQKELIALAVVPRT